MAPKTTKPPSPRKPTGPLPGEEFTRFTSELQSLASKARAETPLKHLTSQLTIYLTSFTLLTLAALSANASQLALSPVYGSIPSAQWHTQLISAALFAGWSGNLFLGRALPFKPVVLIPLLAAYVLPLQWVLEKGSGRLGARWGPVVIEGATVFPVVALSAACVATLLDGAELGWLPAWGRDAAPGLGSYGVFKGMEVVTGRWVGRYVGQTAVMTRVGLEAVAALGYALLAPSRLLLWTLPAVLHTAVWNTHVPTQGALARLNSTLGQDGWVILDRKESVTGYVSVIESVNDGFRLMRCDHSLLGGEWVKFLDHPQFRGNPLAEPVYGVFAMLEAVRLVKTPKKILDKDAKALVM
jgi:hypothetical protein